MGHLGSLAHPQAAAAGLDWFVLRVRAELGVASQERRYRGVPRCALTTSMISMGPCGVARCVPAAGPLGCWTGARTGDWPGASAKVGPTMAAGEGQVGVGSDRLFRPEVDCGHMPRP